MPGHVHFICVPESEGASTKTLADRFKGATTNASWTVGWSGPLWQQKFHDRQLEDADALEMASEYVLNNPVRAGLVSTPEEWLWSGVMDDPP